MKKKLFVSALIFTVLTLCSMCLFACSTKGDEHTHAWGKWIAVDGITHTHTCECGQNETQSHNWDNGLITKEATCKESGLKTYTCLDCGQTRTESIEKTTTHNFGVWTKNDNLSHSHTCSICNKTENTNHNWDNGVITKTATCKDTGVKTFTCLDCGATKTGTIEKNNLHSYQNWVTDGATTHIHSCSVCSNSETANHSWDNGTVTKAPNCKETGTKSFTCADCGATKIETIEKTSIHTWSKWTSDNTETHSHICTVCSENETENHNISNETCTVCGFSYLPATITAVDNATINYTNSSIEMLVDKNTSTINLSNMVKVSPNSFWKLYGANSTLIATKYATLQDGDNNFLIVVSSADGLHDNTYALKIYKSFEISIKFYDVYNSVIKTVTTDTGYKYTIEYTPKFDGYTFNYWKLNNKQTTEFTPYDNVNLYAACTNNTYSLNLNADGGEVAENSKRVTFDSFYTLPVPTKTGHTFTGWYYRENKITDIDGTSLKASKFSENSEIIAKWQVNSYRLTAKCDDYSHGSVTGSGDYDYTSSVTVEATTKAGYTFIGWYNGETLLDSDLTYTFVMPAENVTYTAKWCYLAIENDTNSGTTSELNSTYVVGEEVILTAETYLGYDWSGWYCGEELLSTEQNYTATMPSKDTVYTAKRAIKEEMQIFGFSSSLTSCTIEILKDTSVTEVIIPDYVTNIGAFRNCSNLTSITIGNSVTYIGGYAFEDCINLETVTWDAIACTSTISYGGYHNPIFENCTNLATVVVGDNVTTIPSFAFSYCSNLKTVYWNATACSSAGSLSYPIFENCTQLTTVIIGANVTTIPPYAFVDCNNLESVNWNATACTSAGSFSYPILQNCTQLTTVVIGANVTTIPPYAFKDCSSLTNITIPDSVTSIGEDAFSGCSGLTSVSIGNGVKSIDDFAFSGCSGLTSITIPDSVTSIGNSAFKSCNSLSSATIGNSVTNIGDSAFESCNSLQYNEYGNALYLGNKNNPYVILIKAKNTNIVTCTIYTGTKFIYDYAFRDCSSLTSIIIPNGVTSIGNAAFYGCSGLTSITIPNGVTSIGNAAFYGCSGLTSITIPNGVTSIGNSVLSGCSSLTSVTIGNSVKSIGKYAFSYCSSLTSLTIPDSVTRIGYNTFSYCSSLMSITIPDSVTSIDSDAFHGCSSLTSVTIGNGVTSIGGDAFTGCYRLVEVYNKSTLYITARNSGWGNVGYYAKNVYTTEGGSKLTTNENGFVIYDGNTVVNYVGTATEITIPNTVTIINAYAFSGCRGLTSITIPDSVTIMDSYIFKNCNADLKIYCETASKPTQWNSNWNRQSDDTYNYYTVVWDCKNKG